MKGRKPTPTKLKIVKGNPGGRPLNKDEPEPEIDDVCPEPPDHLSEDAKSEWQRMAPWLYDIGLLTKIDSAAFEAYCTAYSRWVEAEDKIRKHGLIVKSPKGYPMQSPYLPIANKALDYMKNFLVEFGMTPSSRTRVTGTKSKKKEDDPWQ